jgi:aldehyde dehydrogenase (NAD+)
MKQYTKQYIDGQWREGTGNRVMENYDPYTGKLLYSYKAAGLQDVDDAYEAAARAQKEWAATMPAEKSEMMYKLADVLKAHKDDVYDVLTTECGSVQMKAGVEFYGTIDHIRMAANFPNMMEGSIVTSNMPDKTNYIFKKAKGVIGVIAPWNFPFLLAMRSVAPAIATGNAVVLKPSAETPASGFLIAELFEEAGFPKGLLNVICGPSSEIGDAFVQHPIPAHISFTGSTAVGRRIGKIAGEHLKDVSLELGGNNMMAILPDADLVQAAKAASFGAYCHQGQVCMALNRVIVHKDVYDEFIPILVNEVKKLKTGDPRDSEVFIGPLTNKTQVLNVEKAIEDTIKAGAVVALEGHTEGLLVYPWVLTDVTNDMPAARNETFGPVCCVIKADSEEEMIRLANDTNYGLSSCVFTKDLYHGIQFGRQIETGMFFINDQSIGEEAHIVFGGDKDSGVGRFNGQYIVDKFTTTQRIGVQEKDRIFF